MDKKYVTLFKELAQATAATAETVMDYDRAQNDEEGLKTATIMRDDYQALTDAIGEDYVLNKKDAAKLLVSAMILVNQLQDRINNTRRAITGYQTDIIPKLQKIVDEDNDELANELFV